MPRPRRAWVPNGLYHLTIRGNDRQAIFRDDADHQQYLITLRECRDVLPYRLLAFALLPNHVHLVMEATVGMSLSQVMQRVSTGYAKYFNARHQRVGHLLQGRFFSKLVDSDSYLLEITWYVHLNPVRAGLVQQPEVYPWSSYRVYAGIERERFFKDLVVPERILGVFGDSLDGAMQRYRGFVELLTQNRCQAPGAWHHGCRVGVKILQVTSHLEVGGIPRHVVTLARALARRGHAVAVASGGGALTGELGAAGVRHVLLPLRAKSEVHPKLWAAVAALHRVVRRDGIELLHAHTRVGQVVAAAASAVTGVPYVATCHGFYRLRIGRRLFPCWGRRVIAISDAVRQWLLGAGVREDWIATVLNGVDVGPQHWAVHPEESQQFRQAVGLGPGPVVGIIGRIVQVKGHQWLLESFGRVVTDVANAQLLIVGDGPHRPALERVASAMGLDDRVRFVASVPDVRVALAAVDVVAVPSLWEEPFGLTVVEAMAAGRAVVASNAGGIPEIVRDGETGLLVERRDVQGLATALTRLLQDGALRSRLVEAGRRLASERFSSERMAAEAEAVYRSVVR